MEEIVLKRLVKAAYCKKWYIAFIVIASIVIGYIYSYIYNIPEYKSSTTIVLTANSEKKESSETNSITQTDITINKNLVDTYSKIIKSNKILRETIQNLSLEIDEKDLVKQITVEAINNTEILNITVSNEDANFAKDISNEIAKIFTEKVKEIYNINNVNIIDEAEVSEEPYNINHARDISVFVTTGILISLVMVFFVYVLDTTIKQEEDIEETTKLPVLGVVPLEQKVENGDSKNVINEAFRTLRTNLIFAQRNKNMKNILITSCYMSEGKSYISSNLAIAFSKMNKKVLLIDSDMRNGRTDSIFELDKSNGLSECLSELKVINERNVTKYIKVTKIPNVHIITSGKKSRNPSELISSNKIIQLITLLDSIYDVIVIDGTPSILVSDSVALSKFMDTVILVTEYKSTKIESLQKVKKLLENVGTKIAGVVLNKYPISESKYRKGYYLYAYNDSPEEHENDSKIKVKSVEDVVREANINKSENLNIEKEKLKEKFSKEVKDSVIQSNQDNILFQQKIEKIDNELNNIRELFVQYIINNEVASKSDLESLVKEVSCLKQTIQDNSLIVTDEIKKEIEDIKRTTSSLVNVQEKNSEKVKKFIENYKNNKK